VTELAHNSQNQTGMKYQFQILRKESSKKIIQDLYLRLRISKERFIWFFFLPWKTWYDKSES